MKLHTFGFIGLGLIGGSLAKALKRSIPDCRIMAYTRTSKTTETALAQGFIDSICSSADDLQFSECDCIFLCAPTGSNVSALKKLKDLARKDSILTDVGSVKTDIHLAAEEIGLNGRFIGGHPMTGSEKSGLEFAQAHLFENAYYILTPSSGTPDEWIDALHDLVSSFGALPLVLDYQRHDFATAAVSHLPHLIAASLVNTVHDLDSEDELMKMIAAGGFKDITRIASSSPEMWEHICMSNRENITSVMDTFIRLLTDSRLALNNGDGENIYKMFEKSRDYRDSFAASSPGSIKKTFRIYCDVVDESGAIATIATILAVNGINIKNIGIVHSREFEEGVLRIEFYEQKPCQKAAELLRQHRYQIWER
ncbi:MAG: prephenate dehydrogenase [Lachnospiraceae bacterium]|nr:prephenate dehydrogenase [Lachnospiraceae bacterium]